MADRKVTRVRASGKPITAEALRAALYDPQTGIFRKPSGAIVGHQNAKGYVVLCVLGRLNYAHRLAWLYMTGSWPINQIDHINRQKADNRFENLRDATNAENQWNIGLQKNNKSGFRGVSFHRPTKKWRANIWLKSKQISLGYFSSAEDAAAAYERASATLRGDGAPCFIEKQGGT